MTDYGGNEDLFATPLFRGSEQKTSVVAKEALSSPISSLPVEVLQAIFLLDVERAFKALPNAQLTIHMLRLTHVCSFWRSAASGFPPMWFPVSFTPGGNWKLAHLFLERGRSSSLRLSNHLEMDEFRVPPQLKMHSGRLEVICLHTTVVHCATIFKEIGPDFSGLVHLDIAYDFDSRERGGFDEEGAIISIQAPNVRQLELEATHIASLAHFKNLTYLYLSSIGGPLCVEDIVSLLSRSPCLRFLILLDLDRIVGPCNAERMIDLPDLRHVFLSCLGDYLVPFCRYLFPSAGRATKLHILEDFNHVDVESVFEFASKALWMFQTQHELACRIFDEGMRMKTLQINTLPMSPASVTFSFRSYINFETIVLSPRLNLSQVTCLSINPSYAESIQIIGRFSDLRRLAILCDGSGNLKDFADCLGHSLGCHHLEVLRIALPRESDMKAILWMNSLQRRVQNGFARLRTIKFFVRDPKAYEYVDIPYTAIAEELLIERYSDQEWEEWD